MNTVYKRISSVLIVLFLLAVSAVGMGVPLSADAVQESGNIRLLLEPAFEGVGVSLVDIGIVDNGTFKVNDTFSPSGISFEGVETSKQLSAVAEKAVEYAKDNQLEGIVGRVDFDGEINFYEVGTEKVYLLYQYDGFDYVTMQPAIVSVPNLNADDQLEYDISVTPKFTTLDASLFPAALILTKLNHDNDRLPGAVFSFWRKVYYTDLTKEKKSEYEYGEDEGGYYYWKKHFDMETDENGQIALKDVAYGTYRFVEEKAPKGYAVDPTPHEFVLDTHAELKVENGMYVPASGKVMELTVINKPISDNSSRPSKEPDESDVSDSDGPNTGNGGAGGEDDDNPGHAQLTGDDMTKYIIIGAIVGVSFVVVILFFILGGKKKKDK